MPALTKKRKITIDDLFRLKLVGSPELSPDGARCVITVQRTEKEKNSAYTDLYLIELGAGEVRRLTEGDYSDGSPKWSPDGRTLAFISGRSESSQIHLMPMNGGDSLKLTKLEEGAVSGVEWSPDGSKILFFHREFEEVDRKKSREERQKQKLSSPVRVVETAHYRLDGVGWLGATRAHLHTVTVATGEVKQLTKGVQHVGSATWSPDGKHIAYTLYPDELKHHLCKLCVIPAEGGKVRVIETPPGPKGALKWSPDGKLLVYVGYLAESDPWGAYNDHVWVVPADGSGAARDITPDLDRTVSPFTLCDTAGAGGGGLTFSADGKSVDVFIADEGATPIVRAPLKGGKREVLLGGFVHHYAKSREVGGKIVVCSQTPTDPGEAYLLTLGKGKPKKLTGFNDDLLRELDLPTPEAFWVACKETGRKIQGWILKPPGFQPGRKHPMLLEIHGGPHTQYGAGFFHEFHWFAAQGWVLVYTNPAGSQGYGEAFMQALRNHWGEADFPELMAAVDKVLGKGYIDEKRLGVTGGSYGGYMTNWVVGNTNRFCVAATQRCVSNMLSMWGNSDHPMQPDGYFEGNAWSKNETLWRLSPIRFVENIKTPLLVVHSEGDLRCNVEQGEQMYSALKVLRKKTRFVRLPREAFHGVSRGGPPDLRQRRLEELTRWIGEHLSPKGKGWK